MAVCYNNVSIWHTVAKPCIMSQILEFSQESFCQRVTHCSLGMVIINLPVITFQTLNL